MSKSITVNCLVCSKPFSPTSQQLSLGRGRFCSRACASAGNAITGRPPAPVGRRFWPKVDKSGGPDVCWCWSGKRFPNGYGAFFVKKGERWGALLAHRMAYELTHGPIPDKLIICHTCDVRSCCNPQHLFAGSHDDNMRDAANKGRTASGMRNGSNRLSRQEVLQILALDGKASTYEVARCYGVNHNTIWLIWKRKRWQHLSPS